MNKDRVSARIRRIDVGFFAVSLCLLAWAATPETSEGFLLVLASLAAVSSTSLLSNKTLRRALFGVAAVCLPLGLVALLR
jgi:hypothetical protein